jgi:Fe-Mn family superoxide dismutase
MLHNIFFTQFRESRNKNEPNGPIGNLIKQKFKTFDDFKTALYEQAKTIEGSGWVYLSRDGSIKIIHNHQLRDDILILVDMWEHAYIIDYGTDKERYIDKLFNIVDWNSINARWGAAYK